WNWDNAKIALEHLYDIGTLSISNRINFQRFYDVRERVIPEWVDRKEPTEEEGLKRLLEISLRGLGACEPAQVSDYFHGKRTEAKPLVESLVEDGTFVKVNAKLADRKDHELLVHRENIRTLEIAADGEIRASRTTFLTPFDSLFWARGRDMDVWKFNQTLECYVPEPKRKWGYFCLPILYGDRLVGRFDPKVERKTGVLRIKALYLEPGVKPSARLVSGVSRAMRDFMKFHNANDLIIEHSDPVEFGQKLSAAL
ncbi:MAG: winged helix DNA-binding domain-containing protein, partial [Dehalococcoidia bacterium]|nr:winged helix DNA-binding domain-containing protein [Dehalococcoidia bacterium]